ncbi:hypothetical protein HY249_03390 [Candidatus Azambacteria bacterium]|nr:hypothetical protein [Candidatus Azambacteria bacterium]
MIIKKIVTASLFVFTAAIFGITVLSMIPFKDSYIKVGTKKQASQSADQAGGQPAFGVGPANFSIDEIQKHNKKTDCWLVIKDNVYDVSEYVPMHPGGVSAISSNCGRESTSIFASIHSNIAWDLLSGYKIGYVAGTEAASATTSPEMAAGEKFNDVKSAVLAKFPKAKIIKVAPRKNNSYLVKLSLNNALYEIHLDSSFNITKQEVEDDEFNWDFLNDDNDDK